MPPKKSAGGAKSGGAKAGKSKPADDGDKGKGEKKGGTAVKVRFDILFCYYNLLIFLVFSSVGYL